MNITCYDRALLDYIKNMFPNTVWGSPSEAFKNLALTNQDKVKLPLISVWRSDTSLDTNISMAQLRLGYDFNAPDVPEGKIRNIRCLPLDLQYDIDIWGTSDDQASTILCELYFSLMDNPCFNVESDTASFNCKVSFQLKDFSNNSDTIDKKERGNLFRYTIVISCPARISYRQDLDRYRIYLAKVDV